MSQFTANPTDVNILGNCAVYIFMCLLLLFFAVAAYNYNFLFKNGIIFIELIHSIPPNDSLF